MSSYRDSRVFGRSEIETFLRSVDRHLTASAQIVIIGGSAAAFYDAVSTTTDIDTYDAVSAELHGAVAGAVAETGLDIPVARSTVADFPDRCHERFERPLKGLTRLDLCILERHDLALSKTMRGSAHDEQQILEIHAAHPLDLDRLVERYRDEMMRSLVGDERRVRANLLQLVELLFGELKRIAAERTLRGGGPA